MSRLRNARGTLGTALHWALLVCIFTTCIGAVGCRSGEDRVRTWEEAILLAQAELEAAGDLEGRLERYAETADRLGEKIELLDQARPALELIGRLRDVQIPLIGNGWQILLLFLGLATVDGARIIAKLEEVLRGLVDVKDSLEALAGLPIVAEEVRAFRKEPHRGRLESLAEASSTALPAMRRVQADLEEILDPLEEVADNLSALVAGLWSAARVGIPVVSDAARTAAERIGLIKEPLLTLNDGLHKLEQEIGADAEVLERIQTAVQQVREQGSGE